MHPTLQSGDVFLYDGSRGYIRFLPQYGRDTEGSAGLTSPDAFIATVLLSRFARKLGEFPKAKLECCLSGQGSFALFVHHPPDRDAYDESVMLSIAIEDVRSAWETTRTSIPPPSDMRSLLNGPGNEVLKWIFAFFVQAAPQCSLKETELSWHAKLPPRFDARI